MKSKKIVNSKPLFFVFTCVKDGRSYIKALFDSMLNQTKNNFIHYIYEDGSSMPLDSIVDEYKTKAENLRHPFKVIYEKNELNIGLNMSTQHCISKCTCKYFMWIDCDNFIENNFFEELEKTYNLNRSAILIRTLLCSASTHQIKFFNCGTIKDANSKYQLGMLLRRKFYYSFFAVNHRFYMNINPDNAILKERFFYNDEQVLLLCLLSGKRVAFSKKSKGFFLERDNQESTKYTLTPIELKRYQIELCSLVNHSFKNKLMAAYDIKNKYEILNSASYRNTREALKLIRDIKSVSKKQHINRKNFYKSNLFLLAIKVFFRKAKF